MITELSYIKAHLRITDDTEDSLLESYGEAATEVILKAINQAEDDLYDEYGMMPHALKNAVCLIVGAMYQNREATAQQVYNVNPMLNTLVLPYKKIILN